MIALQDSRIANRLTELFDARCIVPPSLQFAHRREFIDGSDAHIDFLRQQAIQRLERCVRIVIERLRESEIEQRAGMAGSGSQRALGRRPHRGEVLRLIRGDEFCAGICVVVSGSSPRNAGR